MWFALGLSVVLFIFGMSIEVEAGTGLLVAGFVIAFLALKK